MHGIIHAQTNEPADVIVPYDELARVNLPVSVAQWDKMLAGQVDSPNHIWPFQDADTAAEDIIGASDLVDSDDPSLFGKSVDDWTRNAVGFTENIGEAGVLAGTVALGSVTLLLLCSASLPITISTHVLNYNYTDVYVKTNGHLQMVTGDTTEGAIDVVDSVIPVLVSINSVDETVKLYTASEKLTGTYTESDDDLLSLYTSAGTRNGVDFLYGAAWDDYSVTDDQARTLLTSLGFSVSWS